MTKHFDPDGLVTTSIEYDSGEDRMIVGSHQNVAPILDDVAARNTDGTAGYGKSRELRLCARIPSALMDMWMREAFWQKIPIYHKRVRDEWLAKKLVGHERLMISGKPNSRVGYDGGNYQLPLAA